MNQPFRNRQFQTILTYFLLAVAIILAYRAIQDITMFFNFLSQFMGIIAPFIYGFVIAYIMNIPCDGVQKLLVKTKNKFISKRSKPISILLAYVATLLLLLLILNILVPQIYANITLFGANFRDYYKSAQELITYANEYLEFLNAEISTEKILPTFSDFIVNSLPASINALFNVSSALFRIFLGLVSSVYILFEKEKFKDYLCRMLRAFLPDSIYKPLLKYTRDLNKNVKRYIYTQTLDGCILGTIATIELSLLGSPYALVLGVMLGVVNYIPYFGSIFGSLFVMVIVAITQGIPMAALTGFILLVTQQIDGNVIQPRLMSGSFSLSPLLVIISITVGGAFYGIMGMLLAIPIVAVFKNILEEIITHYEKKKSLSLKDDYGELN